MIVEMTDDYAKKIISWHYEKPYDIYNMTDYETLMTDYYAVLDGDLIGFCCSGLEAQVPPGHYPIGYQDIGVGMKPDLCGKGLGYDFMLEVILFYGNRLRLSVMTWNKRAIKLYKRLGFVEKERFIRGKEEFIIMIRK